MDVLTAAWQACGQPQPAVPIRCGACTRCGRADEHLAPTRNVVSKVFTGYDTWRDPRGTGLCPACTWGRLLQQNSAALQNTHRLSSQARQLCQDPATASAAREQERLALQQALNLHSSAPEAVLAIVGEPVRSHTHAVDRLNDLIAEWPTPRYENSWTVTALRLSLDPTAQLVQNTTLAADHLNDVFRYRPMFVAAAKALQRVTHHRLQQAAVGRRGEMWIRRGSHGSGASQLAAQLLGSAWAFPSPATGTGSRWTSAIPQRQSGDQPERAAVTARLTLGVLTPASIMPKGQPLEGPLSDPVSWFANMTGTDGLVARLLVPVNCLVALPGGLLARRRGGGPGRHDIRPLPRLDR